MKAKKLKIGDWVFITGSYQIRQDYWDKHHPRGIFGKVIQIDVRYSQFDGTKRPDTIWIRAYVKKDKGRTDKHPHYKTYYKHLKLLD